MANYSKEELQYIASQVQPYLLELVKSNGLDVDSIEVVEDTDGITSLPAYDNRGGVKKVVRVPLSTFAKPAQDAADSIAESIAKADAAAENANAAAENANGVLVEIDSIKADIEKAVEDVQKALDEVQEAVATVTEKVDEINASEGAREEAEQARQEAETARVTEYGDLKNQMNAALVDMDTATESALDTANHPTYVGEDNYVYQWDKAKKVYVKTDIYVKGDDGAPGPQGPQGEKGEKGENGSGSGNVLVSVGGLVKGKTYLFTPSQNGSAEGTFVEYEVPQIDTSNIATKKDIEGKVDKVDGKGLSTEDFTTILKQKLEGLNNYDDAELTQALSSLQSQLNTLVSGNASAAINNFNEIISFLEGVSDSENLDNIIAAINQNIAAKQNEITDLAAIRSGASKGATALQPQTRGSGTKFLADDNTYKEVDALPEGGTAGQVLTKTEEGAAWSDPSSGAGFVAQTDEPEDTSLLWVDTDDTTDETDNIIGVDAYMSDTSVNPVQNAVVKQYIDSRMVEVTEAEYEALGDSVNSDGVLYLITE